MKKTFLFILIVSFFAITQSCQDDFCLDITTPSLVIRFYDKDNVTETKSIALIVWANDMDTLYNGTVLDSLSIPLDTQNNSVVYHFSILNETEGIDNLEDVDDTNDDEDTDIQENIDEADDLNETDDTEDIDGQENLDETANPEDITITYTTEDIYVSKACGFKSVFNNLTVETTKNNWIDSSEIITTEITNENETHVKIYH